MLADWIGWIGPAAVGVVVAASVVAAGRWLLRPRGSATRPRN